MRQIDSSNQPSRRSCFPIPIRIVVYPSDESPGYLTAHCLELDLVGEDITLGGAVLELIENIAAQVMACEEHDARLYVPAPAWVSDRYLVAKEHGTKIPDELMERVIAQVTGERIDDIFMTERVTEDYKLANV